MPRLSSQQEHEVAAVLHYTNPADFEGQFLIFVVEGVICKRRRKLVSVFVDWSAESCRCVEHLERFL